MVVNTEGRISEQRIFRMIQMACCKRIIEWIDPRRMNYCPECGRPTFALDWTGIPGIIVEDSSSTITFSYVKSV